jgi:hypothetical protein
MSESDGHLHPVSLEQVSEPVPYVFLWWHAEARTRRTGADSFDSAHLKHMINYVVEMFPGEMMGQCSSRLDVSRVVKKRIPKGNRIIGV